MQSDEDTNKIKVVYVEPGKPARVLEIDNELGAMQELVKGNIEIGYIWDTGAVLLANEEGMVRDMEPNRFVVDGLFESIIYGPFFICNLFEEEFVSIPDADVDIYLTMFKNPEIFAKSKLPYRGRWVYLWQKEGQDAELIPDPRTGLVF